MIKKTSQFCIIHHFFLSFWMRDKQKSPNKLVLIQPLSHTHRKRISFLIGRSSLIYPWALRWPYVSFWVLVFSERIMMSYLEFVLPWVYIMNSSFKNQTYDVMRECYSNLSSFVFLWDRLTTLPSFFIINNESNLRIFSTITRKGLASWYLKLFYLRRRTGRYIQMSTLIMLPTRCYTQNRSLPCILSYNKKYFSFPMSTRTLSQ